MRSGVRWSGDRESQEIFLGAVFDNLADGVLVIDGTDVVCAVNAAAGQLLGFEPEELVGEEAALVLPSEWRELAKGGTVELVLRSRRGGSVPAEVAFSGMAQEGGTLTVCTVRDVTERRLLEQQVREAQRLETVGTLAGGMAHEFNNILTVILAAAGLVQSELGADHPSGADLDAIVRQGDRAARLVRQILTFSRRSPVLPRRVAANTVVAEMVGFFSKVFGRQFHFQTDLGELPTIHAEPTLVEQVLVNLCLNARDAMPLGGRIRISTRRVLLTHPRPSGRTIAPGAYVELSVADSGVGMDAAVVSRMFEPFFTTKIGGQGAGLGLSVVHGIVEQQGGFIEVESEPGRGTTVFVLLRAMEDAVVDPPAPPRSSSLSRRTLLLAEDDHAVRRVMTEVLRKEGFNVVAAGDGIEARALFDAEPERFSAAVLDWVMPRMGGLDLFEAISRRRPDLPVLWVSGVSSGLGSVLNAQSDYLPKPFTSGELGERMHALLDRVAVA